MRKATRTDKSKIIHILTQSFDKELLTNWVVKQDKRCRQRMHALMDYAFEKAFPMNEIYLSQEEAGVAIWNYPNEKRTTLQSAWRDITFAFTVCSPERVLQIAKMESYIQGMHPKDKFLHLWFLGVLPSHQGKGISSSLMNPILSQCDYEKLPVYLETSNTKNVAIYATKGFKVFHEWDILGTGPTVWFMYREPQPFE
jgi:GNAT superfamily N-acetyltransferase